MASFQLRDAVHVRVFRLAVPDRLDGRFLDVVRRIEIRLACAKADHVLARRFQARRPGGYGDGRRGLHASKRVGQESHGQVSVIGGCTHKTMLPAPAAQGPAGAAWRAFRTNGNGSESGGLAQQFARRSLCVYFAAVTCPLISPALFAAVWMLIYNWPAFRSAICWSVSLAEPSNWNSQPLQRGWATGAFSRSGWPMDMAHRCGAGSVPSK